MKKPKDNKQGGGGGANPNNKGEIEVVNGTRTDLPIANPLNEADGEYSDSDESEIDIGILSHSKKKLRMKKQQGVGGATDQELLFQSVQHVANVFARRVDTVRIIVGEEMKDVKTICSVIGDVIEILSRRSSDLSKQQKTFIESLGL